MQFIFEHNTNALLPFLNEAEQHINAIIAGRGDGMLVEKCKFILTELCTNGIKHSGTEQSVIEIYGENNCLILQKKDDGLPLCPAPYNNNTALQLLEEADSFILTEDFINRLVMVRIDAHSVNFCVEDVPLTSQPLQQNMTEHFGLIIICRSSSNFTYSHLPGGLNVFTVVLEIA